MATVNKCMAEDRNAPADNTNNSHQVYLAQVY